MNNEFFVITENNPSWNEDPKNIWCNTIFFKRKKAEEFISILEKHYPNREYYIQELNQFDENKPLTCYIEDYKEDK